MLKTIILSFIALVSWSTTAFALPVDAEYIPSQKYYETTLNAINTAKSSISVYMYFISISPTQPEAQSTKLIKALIQAKGRGVKVHVVLDQNMEFSENEIQEDWLYKTKNRVAYELLRKNDIPVFFDEPQNYTHAKALIIDEETVILGSTNWSKAALTRNNEANTIIKSKDFAKEVLAELGQIKLQDVKELQLEYVSIPTDVFRNERLIGEMVGKGDERTFDTYLYLLKEYDGGDSRQVVLSFENLAQILGIEGMRNEDYRRQITKVLDKLKDKYQLIDYVTERNKDAIVTLK